MSKAFKVSLVGAVLLGFVAAGAHAAEKYYFDQTKLLKPVSKTLNFVFIPKLVHPWYKDVEYGAQAAIEEFKKQGVNINMKWDAPPTADINEQIRKIEANISARPDGIAIAALDPASDTPVIKEAVKAGLNVITFDVDAPDSGRLMYVGHNGDYQDGFDAGELIAKKIGGKGKVGVMTGSLAAPNHVNRVKGFKAAIAKYKDISIVFEQSDNDDYQKAVDLAESAIQAHPDMVGFYGCNPGNLIGMARVVKKAGLTGKIVLVGDSVMPETIELLKDDVIYMGNAQRQWDEGYWSVKYLVAINQNHTYPKVHETGAMPVTKNDLIKWGMLK